MESQQALSASHLISLLKKYESQNYIFRGHNDSSYLLQPATFREKNLEEQMRIIPHSRLLSWCASADIERCIAAWYKPLKNDPILQRFFKVIHFSMTYHYKLALANFEQPPYPIIYYKARNKFIQNFEFMLSNAISYYHLTGELLKPGMIYEDVTGLEYDLPQHYGTPTMAMDWSLDPFIALFFSLYKIKTPKFIAIYVYQETKITDQTPIRIERGRSNINNPRRIAQKGVFTCFNFSLSYFLKNGRWPTILDYDRDNNFKLVHLYLEITEREKLTLREELRNRGINQNSLLLTNNNLYCT